MTIHIPIWVGYIVCVIFGGVFLVLFTLGLAFVLSQVEVSRFIGRYFGW